MNATKSFPYFDFQAPLAHAQDKFIGELSALKILTTVAAIVIGTRIWTGITTAEKKYNDGSQDPPSKPYWIPLIGPFVPFLFGFDRYMQKIRDESVHGLLSLGIGGSKHVFLYTPSLTKKLFGLRSPVTDDHFLIWPVCHRFLGFPNSVKAKWEARWSIAMEPIVDGLTKDPHLSDMTDMTIRRVEENTANLASFMERPIDQSLWERASNADVIRTETGVTMEVDLWNFLRHYSGLTTGPALTGQAFFDNNPFVIQDVFDFDDSAFWLLIGTPWWFPMPSLGKSIRARKRLQDAFTSLHEALDAEADGKELPAHWQDIDDVGYTLRQRQKNLRDAFTPAQRGAADISIFWAMHANVNNLIFWLILHIVAVPGLVEDIRKEIARYCVVTQGASVLGRQAPPRLKIDAKGLRKCALLRSCYFEALRLHGAAWSVHKVNKDVILTEDAKDVKGGTPGKFRIRAGTIVDVPHAIQHLDPRLFENPEDFVPNRFIITDAETGEESIKAGEVRVFGGGGTICKGRMLAERESLAMAASILALWDIKPAKGDIWKIPGHQWATGMLKPNNPCRARISRRPLGGS